ncbi:hypothetical protein Trydic_g9664 [Trypoxylus dichotomus]
MCKVPRRTKEDYKNRPPSNLRLNLVVMKWAPCNVTEEAGPVGRYTPDDSAQASIDWTRSGVTIGHEALL